MTVLCIEELTEGDLRILADHPRRPHVATSCATRAVPSAAPIGRVQAPERRDAGLLQMPIGSVLAGSVS